MSLTLLTYVQVLKQLGTSRSHLLLKLDEKNSRTIFFTVKELETFTYGDPTTLKRSLQNKSWNGATT